MEIVDDQTHLQMVIMILAHEALMLKPQEERGQDCDIGWLGCQLKWWWQPHLPPGMFEEWVVVIQPLALMEGGEVPCRLVEMKVVEACQQVCQHALRHFMISLHPTE